MDFFDFQKPFVPWTHDVSIVQDSTSCVLLMGKRPTTSQLWSIQNTSNLFILTYNSTTLNWSFVTNSTSEILNMATDVWINKLLSSIFWKHVINNQTDSIKQKI